MEFIMVGDKDPSKNTDDNIDKVDAAIKDGKDVFIMFFSNGCPPCEAAKPVWDKLNHHDDIKNKDNVVVVRIEAGLHNADNMGATITGVPTFRYIKNKKIEELTNGDIKHFINIILDKTGSKSDDKSDRKTNTTSKNSSNSSSNSIKGGRKRRRTIKRKGGRGRKNSRNTKRRRRH